MTTKFRAMLSVQLQMMAIVMVGGLFGGLVFVAMSLFGGTAEANGWASEFIGLYMAAILGYFATPWALGSAFQNGVSRKLFLQTAAVGLVVCSALMAGFVTAVSAVPVLAGTGSFLASVYHLAGVAGILWGVALRFMAYLAFAAIGAALGFLSLPFSGKVRFALMFGIYGLMVLPGLALALIVLALPHLVTDSGMLQFLLALVGLPLHRAPQPQILLLIFTVLTVGFGFLAVRLGRRAELNDRV